jgi:hypothetical protein
VRTVSRATIGRQQPQQRPPVLIARRPRRSHAGNLPGDGRSSPSRPGTGTTALAARPAAHTAAALREFTIVVGSSAGGAYPAGRGWVASARSCLIRDPRVCLISQARAAVFRRFAWPGRAGRGPSPGRRGWGRGW